MLTTSLMVGAALLAIAGFGGLFSMWWRSEISDDYEILRVASQEFINGRPIVAGELAESVELAEPTEAAEADGAVDELPADAEPASPGREAAGEAEPRSQWILLRNFLVGAGRVARANQEEDLRQRRHLLHEAVPFLESARDAGFPPGRQTDGYRLLGESLFALGRYDDAIAAIRKAIDRSPMLRRSLLRMLAESQLRSPTPQAEQALETIRDLLGDPAIQPQERWAGELIRVRILIALKRWQEASESLRRQLAEPPSSELSLQGAEIEYRDELVLLQAVNRISQAIERYGARPTDPSEDRSRAAEELAETDAVLGDLQREASPGIASQARLWSARALLVQGRFDEALTRLTAVRQHRPFGAEAMLGGLEEIELLASQGNGVELLQATRFLMHELGDRRGFDARLIALDEFQRRLAVALEELRHKGEFQHAIDAARSMSVVFEASEALTQEGLGYRQWAEATLAEGKGAGGEVSPTASVLARTRFRAAGDAFAEAARQEFNSPRFTTTQWSAIDAYQRGRHFSQSIRLLEPYLRYEERRRHPRGLVAFARALLADDKPAQAIEALTTCIVEFPRDPLRYDARLLAALAHAEQGDLDSARALLIDNLQDGELTPQSPAWRDSLLTLGELLYQRGYENDLAADRLSGAEKIALLRDNQGILEQAVRYLDEAVERYWPLPRAESAAYLSARARAMSAHWSRLESQSPEILDAARRTLRAQAEQELKTALDGFVNLRQHLAGRDEEQPLPADGQAILRNCMMAEADVLRDMNRFEEAASAYRAVELRYINEPPALEAIIGRASCARRLGRPQEANKLIRQARVVLQRIPSEWDGRFEQITRHDRAGWQALLAWMNQRIDSDGGV
jgi:tetratricopeptide (TPR) repeat protein